MILPELSLRSWATILSVALLLAVVRIEEGRVSGARQRAGELALKWSNARAERDSTRLIEAGNARMVRDSLRQAQRLVVQEGQRTVFAEVRLSEAPDTDVMSMHVVLDTLQLETRVGRATPDANGIREATVSVAGPKWATVRFDRVEQSPELCASSGIELTRPRHSWLGGFAPVVGAGPVLGLGGRVNFGVFVGLGYAHP